ncbi:hypothetical protein C8035_v006338 [Colletotrichum spinosum]|uniref:Uncharacterized protein n=1 Tax=Colletotrichum spinosum TaxID=1347390 RepID=A0A4V3HTD8_9PEZI|nr:hypothetical protein C8035_v006338 [Colletotrichum spinosum]
MATPCPIGASAERGAMLVSPSHTQACRASPSIHALPCAEKLATPTMGIDATQYPYPYCSA